MFEITVATFQKFFTEFFYLIYHFSPALCIGAMTAGLVHVFLSAERLNWFFSTKNRFASLNALIMAAFFPGCSCSVIQHAETLIKKHIRRELIMIFIVIGPQIGPYAIFLSVCFLGWNFTILRIIVALIMMLGVILAINFLSNKKAQGPRQETGKITTPKTSWSEKIYHAYEHGFGETLQEIRKPFLIAMGLAAFMNTFNVLYYVKAFSDSPLTYLATFISCGFFDICAADSTPIAGAMLSSKVSICIVIIFIVAGPSINYMLIDFVRKTYDMKHAIVYVVVVGAVTIALSSAIFLFDMQTSATEVFSVVSTKAGGHHDHSLIDLMYYGFFFAILMWAFFLKKHDGQSEHH